MNFAAIFIIAILIFCIWELGLRKAWIKNKYAEDTTGIVIPEDIDNVKLFGILKEHLKCNLIKEIFINEKGNVAIAGKYGVNELIIDSGHLYVGREQKTFRSDSKTVRNFEQAECFKAYIQKVFDVNAPVNPYKKNYRIQLDRKLKVIAYIITGGFLVALIITVLFQSGIWTMYFGTPEEKLKAQYLPEYSNEISIGEAIDSYLDSETWSSYSEKGVQYVIVRGRCNYMDVESKVCITFEVYDDSVSASIEIDDIPMPSTLMEQFYEAAYESANEERNGTNELEN